MVYSVHLYVVNPRRESFFISSMRGQGLYPELARRTLPGFMGIDLLRNHQDASEFLCLTFWTSIDKYAAAQSSSNQAVLARFLEKLTITSAHLGTFSFPAPERLIPRFPGTHLEAVRRPGGLSIQSRRYSWRFWVKRPAIEVSYPRTALKNRGPERAPSR